MCACAHVNPQAGSFGILMSVVCRPPIVSCDPLSRLLPKELYLPLLVITAHKEQHDKNMSYLSACASFFAGRREATKSL